MEKLRQKPFALIGVNIDRLEPEALKRVIGKEKLNWRSFADDRTISRQWNSPATPTFYLIDHVGTIRRKWVGSPGGKAIDREVEKLMEETKE